MKEKFLAKRKLIIIISAVLAILIAAGVVLYFCVFSCNSDDETVTSFTGAWELTGNPEVAVSTADEIPESEKAYYVFDEPNKYGEGTWRTYYAGGVEHFKYELLEEDGVEKINLGSVNLEYKFSGSRNSGNAKVELIYPEQINENTGEKTEAMTYVLEQASAPDYENSAFDDFKTDESLLSKWTSNERTVAYYYYDIPYVQTIEFNDNGIMVIHYESEDLTLDRYMYYAYTIADSELTFSLVTDKDTKNTVSFEFDADGNLKFLNDKTASSIFADNIFGDFTYYTDKNLPKRSEASYDELYFTE